MVTRRVTLWSSTCRGVIYSWPQARPILAIEWNVLCSMPEYAFITACCAGNVARMFPTYVQRMWMSTAGDGLAAVLFGPSSVTAVVGRKQQTVEIVEETSYPFSERI